MANAFIIEINGKAAGLVVEEKGGFRFFASHRIFWKLDGRIYRRVREAEKAAHELWNLHVEAASGKTNDPLKANRPDLRAVA
ncbi:MAG: hypothetical protein AB7M05_03530 [Alphaproteobacteria bacterium]